MTKNKAVNNSVHAESDHHSTVKKKHFGVASMAVTSTLAMVVPSAAIAASQMNPVSPVNSPENIELHHVISQLNAQRNQTLMNRRTGTGLENKQFREQLARKVREQLASQHSVHGATVSKKTLRAVTEHVDTANTINEDHPVDVDHHISEDYQAISDDKNVENAAHEMRSARSSTPTSTPTQTPTQTMDADSDPAHGARQSATKPLAEDNKTSSSDTRPSNRDVASTTQAAPKLQPNHNPPTASQQGVVDEKTQSSTSAAPKPAAPKTESKHTNPSETPNTAQAEATNVAKPNESETKPSENEAAKTENNKSEEAKQADIKANDAAKQENDVHSADEPKQSDAAQTKADAAKPQEKSSEHESNVSESKSEAPASESETASSESKLSENKSEKQEVGSSKSIQDAPKVRAKRDVSTAETNATNKPKPESSANSQVIAPNTNNQTAGDKEDANKQVQTDAKPEDTYRLRILYTIGGAPNKQLVQPYELTIDKTKFNSLGENNTYEYIELPKTPGYAPSFYHSGNYNYYVKDENGAYVIDDGTHGTGAVRYLRLSKELIHEFATKKTSPIGHNNAASTGSTGEESDADATQHFGELNINYAPKLAKYYVRHMVQDLNDNTKFHEAPGVGQTMEVTHADGRKETIHVVEVTGTVGSTVTAMATHIPGYEPENNVISSPLSDSEKDSDKLILNLRYYRKAYEVTYDTGGGSDVTAQRVYFEDTVPSVENPTWRGHTFLGWEVVDPSKKKSSNGNELFESSETMVAQGYKMPDHNVQLRALWQANEQTSYRINVWVQKADLVDPEHPNSLVNYDFIDTVVRKGATTDSTVDLTGMDDTGSMGGKDSKAYLGFTNEELQGKDGKGGLIRKFNWMNDEPITNFKEDNNSEDNFTRYFHVNKELTRQLNEQTRNVAGLGVRAKNRLAADDLQNVLNVVYDRKTYELIFASSSVLDTNDTYDLNDEPANPAIYIKGKDGKIRVYCYNDGTGCSANFDKEDYDWHADEVYQTAYHVKARFGQKLTPELFPRSSHVECVVLMSRAD